ncbi:MAG: hypothetical protein K2G12_06015 [Prevotella sp.]|nr:hypothetical protein [Prevotella sp.]
MKNLQSLCPRWAVILFCICLVSLHCTAQEIKTRTSNGIIEICKNIGKGKRNFSYTNQEAKFLCDSLENNSENLEYSLMYPEKKQLEKAADAGKEYRNKVYSEFTKTTDARIKLEGGRLAIRVYIKPDGSVVLRDISCSFNMLEILGSNGIDKLIRIVNSNKVKPSYIKGNYRTEWTCTLKFPYLKDNSERVVDDVLERKVRNEKLEVMYVYTTLKARKERIMLLNNTKKVSYYKMYPGEKELKPQIEACDKYHDYIYNEFMGYTKNADKLKGKRIMIRVYSTPDGAVILNSIGCRDDLLTPMGAKEMEKLVEIVKSYKFNPSNIKGDYRLAWSIPIQFPE